MEPAPAEIATILRALGAAPRRLTKLTASLDAPQLSHKPSAADWSLNDILAHLRAAADVWGKSILTMIAQDHPTLRYVSPRTYMRKTNYAALDFRVSLAAYSQQRKELLAVLKPLAPKDWARGATFTATTKGREQTLLSYAQRIVSHEAEHLEQIEALLGDTVR